MSFPSFRHESEERDQGVAERRSAQFSRASSVGAGHGVIWIGVAAEHGDQYIEMRGVFNVPARRVGRGFGHYLANRRLHLIRIGLGLNRVEIEVQCRLVDAVEILEVS